MKNPTRGVLLAAVTLILCGCERDFLHYSPDPLLPNKAEIAVPTGAVSFGHAGLMPQLDPEIIRRENTAVLSKTPSGEYAVVIVRPSGSSGGGAAASPPSVDNFSDAVTRVRPGGTIRVLPGTYIVDEVIIEKPVTIESHQRRRPLIHNSNGSFSFRINGATHGEVTFRGLDFELEAGSRSSIQAFGAFNRVNVEDCSFRLLGSQLEAAFAAVEFGHPPNVPPGSGLVTGSRFEGGQLGVFTYAGADVNVFENLFSNQVLRAIQYQMGGGGVAENNEVAGCGFWGCAAAVFHTSVTFRGNRFSRMRTDAASNINTGIAYHTNATGQIIGNTFDGCGNGLCILATHGAEIEVLGNTFDIFAQDRTRWAIVGDEGTLGELPDFASRAPHLHIADNVIRGIGGNPNEPDGHAIGFGSTGGGGILIQNGATAVLNRNEIENGHFGIAVLEHNPHGVSGSVGGRVTSGTDNVVTNVFNAIFILGADQLALQRSDFTDYRLPIAGPGHPDQIDLTCNWWGSIHGPALEDLGFGFPNDLNVYFPWAMQPIAGNPGVTC